MSDKQEPQRTQRFGSMQKQRETVEQFQTIGGGKGDMPQDTLTSKRQNVKTSEQEDMKRQTVYMPKRLATKLKIHAAATGKDISGIITQLVESYLDDAERNK